MSSSIQFSGNRLSVFKRSAGSPASEQTERGNPFNATVRSGLAAGYLKAPKLSRFRNFISPQAFAKMNHLEQDTVTFSNVDGIRLKGYWYPAPDAQASSNKTTVLGHGYCAHAGSMVPLIKPLHQLGQHVFLFDFRAHGQSSGARTSIGFHEGKDVAAAVQCVHEKYGPQAEKVNYLGHSMGAAAFLFMPKSIEAHPELRELVNKRLDKVVLDSSYAVINPSEDRNVLQRLQYFPVFVQKWLLGIVKGFEEKSGTTMQLPVPIHQLYPAKVYMEQQPPVFKPKPLMLLHGKQDTRTSYEQAEAILQTLKQGGQIKVKLIPLEADHDAPHWKPQIDHKKGYSVILRDEERYLSALQTFLKDSESSSSGSS